MVKSRKRKRRMFKAHAREVEREVEIAGYILEMKDIGGGVLEIKFQPEYTSGGNMADIARELNIAEEEDKVADDDHVSGIEGSIIAIVRKTVVVKGSRR
jgi:hypothetical protein